MQENEFGVIVCTPTEIVVMLEVLRKQSAMALQGCDKAGADVIYSAWQGKYEMVQADVAEHFSNASAGETVLEEVHEPYTEADKLIDHIEVLLGPCDGNPDLEGTCKAIREAIMEYQLL